MKTLLLRLRGRFVKKIRLDDLVSITNWNQNDFMVWFYSDKSKTDQVGLLCDDLTVSEH